MSEADPVGPTPPNSFTGLCSRSLCTPKRNFNIRRGDDDAYVDVELCASKEFTRIHGIDFSMNCTDFIVNVCLSLNLNPSEYILLVPVKSFSDKCRVLWGIATPKSQLSHWLHCPTNCLDSESSAVPCLVRLVEKDAFRHDPKLYVQEYDETSGFIKPVKAPKTGTELLKELGVCIVVNLPKNRATVIRAKYNRPIIEAIQSLCTKRSIQPNDYYVVNSLNGDILNPLDNFESQNILQIGLQECSCKSPLQNNMKNHNEPCPDAVKRIPAIRVTCNEIFTVTHQSLDSTATHALRIEKEEEFSTKLSLPANPVSEHLKILNRGQQVKRKKRPAPLPPPQRPCNSDFGYLQNADEVYSTTDFSSKESPNRKIIEYGNFDCKSTIGALPVGRKSPTIILPPPPPPRTSAIMESTLSTLPSTRRHGEKPEVTLPDDTQCAILVGCTENGNYTDGGESGSDSAGALSNSPVDKVDCRVLPQSVNGTNEINATGISDEYHVELDNDRPLVNYEQQHDNNNAKWLDGKLLSRPLRPVSLLYSLDKKTNTVKYVTEDWPN